MGIIVVSLFGVLWLGVMIAIRPWAVEERREQIAAALVEGRAFFAGLGLPPQADTLSSIEESSTLRRGPRATLTQSFTATGFFADTVAWYRERLEAQGWRPFDPSRWRDFYADFCKAPWIMEIQRDASFEDLSDPYHRFTLRLSWYEGMEPERCPYPGD